MGTRSGGRAIRVVGILGLLFVTVACGGCGATDTTDIAHVTPGPSAAVEFSPASSDDGSDPLLNREDPQAPGVIVNPVFTELAARLAPMPIYGPLSLSEEWVIPSQWTPVLELEAPDEYDGPPMENPAVWEDQVAEPEAQIVMRGPDGWVVWLENFRGDLGETGGLPVSSVGGNPASLYELQGGLLIQWSDAGRWYGMFGRAITEKHAIDLVARVGLIERCDP